MDLLIYLLKVSCSLLVFYSVFYLFFRKLTFFEWNRAYLLTGILFSYLAPLFTFELPSKVNQISSRAVNTVFVLEDVSPLTQVSPLKEAEKWGIHFSMEALLLLLYGAGALWMLIRLASNLRGMVRKIKSSPLIYKEGLQIIEAEGMNASFFHFVFLNKSLLSPQEQEGVLAHEKCHVQKGHSIDVLLLEINKAILWFNPLVYLYKYSLLQTHEYEVDSCVTRHLDKATYAHLLLKLNSQSSASLLHLFSHHPVSSRIHMLFTKNSSAMKKLTYMLFLPALLISLILGSCQRDQLINPTVVAADATETKALIKSNTIRTIPGSEKLGKNPVVIINGKGYPASILTRIDPHKVIRMGVFPAENKEITEKLTNKYGAETKLGEPADGFVILDTADENFRIQTKQGLDNIIRENAIPPGQLFTRLTLKDDQGVEYDKVISRHGGGSKVSVTVPKGGKVLYFVDGREYAEETFKLLDRKILESVSESGAGDSAEEIVGEQGKGIAYITLKTK